MKGRVQVRSYMLKKKKLLGNKHVVFSNQLYKQYINVLLAICLMSFVFFFSVPHSGWVERVGRMTAWLATPTNFKQENKFKQNTERKSHSHLRTQIPFYPSSTFSFPINCSTLFLGVTASFLFYPRGSSGDCLPGSLVSLTTGSRHMTHDAAFFLQIALAERSLLSGGKDMKI